MSVKEKAENHPLIFYFGVFLVGFGFGFATSKALAAREAEPNPGNKSLESRKELEVQSFTVDCNGESTLCDQYLNLTVPTDEILRIKYYVGSTQCHSIRLHFYVNGKFSAKSEFLGWNGAPPEYASLLLDTGFINLGPVAAGSHNVRIQAEGQPSGCSGEGKVRSWGGSLRIVT